MVSGQEFWRPFVAVPARWLLATIMSVFRALSPALEADLLGTVGLPSHVVSCALHPSCAPVHLHCKRREGACHGEPVGIACPNLAGRHARRRAGCVRSRYWRKHEVRVCAGFVMCRQHVLMPQPLILPRSSLLGGRFTQGGGLGSKSRKRFFSKNKTLRQYEFQPGAYKCNLHMIHMRWISSSMCVPCLPPQG